VNAAPARFAALGSLCLPVPAAAQSPLSYLHTFGPAGNPATTLGWALGVVSIAVTVAVGGLWSSPCPARDRSPSTPAF
jgi:hypothetical protein